MSSPEEENKGRVEVDDLPRKQEELKDSEAKEIKGGGGASGVGGDIRSRTPGPGQEPEGGRGGIGGEF